MASSAPSDSATNGSDGPVLSLINKRLRALRKKFNRILQMEDSVAQGKVLIKEQEEVLRSKPAVSASIEELEKLRQPLAAAVSEEISLAMVSVDASRPDQESSHEPGQSVEDLLNLLYFGSLFDVKSQSEFTSTMFTRTHERGCCLTYDTVTDDATDLLGDRDLDMISMLSGLLISRPVDSSLSHKDALQRCVQHATLWLANADQPIGPDAEITYAGLRERLKKIMASDYYTTTPEMKAPVEVAAAAAGNYASFQVPVHPSMPVTLSVDAEGPSGEYQQKDERTGNHVEPETGDDQSAHSEELQKDEELEDHVEAGLVQQALDKQELDGDNNEKDQDVKERQNIPRRPYQNQRGRGGGRRAYSNGRGGRSAGRGGSYQNGRYDQSVNYYPRNYYSRGRGGRGGSHGGRASEDVSVAS